ncbi:MAG: hypothetical protein WCJ56_13545 [bacterium]
MDSEERAEIDESYRGVIRLHSEVKGLIIACEKIERNQNANISAIAELRSAFDHVMRTHAVIFGIETEESISTQTNMTAYDYCKSNIDKALGHLYRAGYDAYDIISISLSEKIRNILEGRSSEALFHVIPEFAAMTNMIENAEALIISAKVQKDVQAVDIEQAQFLNYATANTTLERIYRQLVTAMPQVLSYEEEQGKKQKKEQRRALIINIIIAIATLVIGVVIGKLTR